MVSYHWGVDSSQPVTNELYHSVQSTYGKPEFWGRYLTRVEGSVEGLTENEIELLHNSDTKILPIYNDFRQAVGESHAKVVAMNAAYHAKRLGLKKGTIIFARMGNLEVDSGWIKGYVGYLYNTDYKPGFLYKIDGSFEEAYCQAADQDRRVANQAVLWNTEPHTGVTNEEDAPNFEPTTPNCDANVWAWQYGRDAEELPINTNLIDSRLLPMLY